MAADPTIIPKIQKRSGGNLLAVASGGTIEVETGGVVSFNGTDVTAALAAAIATPVAGVAAGYLLARGESTLDGSNATPITTGLTTVIAFVAILKGSVAPGVGTCCLTSVISSGTANVYAWKPTGAGDCTLIASTGTESFYWIAVGV